MSLIVGNNIIWEIIWTVDPTDEVMRITSWKENLLEVWMKLYLYKVSNKVVTQREIVRVSTITWNVIGIERAIESCPLNDNATENSQIALEFSSWDFFSNNFTAEDIKYIEDEIATKVWEDDETITKQGNEFNGVEQLVKTDDTGKIDADLIPVSSDSSDSSENLLIKDMIPGETNEQVNGKDPVFLYGKWYLTVTRTTDAIGNSYVDGDSDLKWYLVWDGWTIQKIGQYFQPWTLNESIYTWISQVDVTDVKKIGNPSDSIICKIYEYDYINESIWTLISTSTNTTNPSSSRGNQRFYFDDNTITDTNWYAIFIERTWSYDNSNYYEVSWSNYSQIDYAWMVTLRWNWSTVQNTDDLGIYVTRYYDSWINEDTSKIYKRTSWDVLWLYSWVTTMDSEINLINSGIYEHYEDIEDNTDYYITSTWELTTSASGNTLIGKSVSNRKILLDI